MENMNSELFPALSGSLVNDLAGPGQGNTDKWAAGTFHSFDGYVPSFREYFSSTDPCHPINLPNNIAGDDGVIYTAGLLQLHQTLWALSDEDANRLGSSVIHHCDDRGKLWRRRLLGCGRPSSSDKRNARSVSLISQEQGSSDIFGNLLPHGTGVAHNHNVSQFFGGLQKANTSHLPFQYFMNQATTQQSHTTEPIDDFDWREIAHLLEPFNNQLCADKMNFAPSTTSAATSPTVVGSGPSTPSTVGEGSNDDHFKFNQSFATSSSGHVAGNGARVSATMAGKRSLFRGNKLKFVYQNPVNTAITDTPRPEPSPFDFSKPPIQASTGPIRKPPTRPHQNQNPHAAFKFTRSSTPEPANPDYLPTFGPDGPVVCGWTTDGNNQPLATPCQFVFRDTSHDAIQAHLLSHLPEYRQDIPIDTRGRISCMWGGCRNSKVMYPMLVEHIRKQHLALYWKCQQCGSVVKKGNEKNRHKQATETTASRCDVQLMMQERDKAREAGTLVD